MNKLYFIFPVIISICFFTACSMPPTEEMNKAVDAVIRAENDADAVAFAPNTLIRARDTLVRMQSEADAKRYDEAKSFAAEAIALAERAISDGKTGAGMAKNEAADIINSVSGLLGETKSAFNTAKAAGDLDLDFDSLLTDMSFAQIDYDEAVQDFEAGNFKDAIDGSQIVRSQLSDINTRINNAAYIVVRTK